MMKLPLPREFEEPITFRTAEVPLDPRTAFRQITTTTPAPWVRCYLTVGCVCGLKRPAGGTEVEDPPHHTWGITYSCMCHGYLLLQTIEDNDGYFKSLSSV